MRTGPPPGASVDLIAHRDAGKWLTALAIDHGHLLTPPSVEDVQDGRVQTVLSGHSLIGLLIELWDARSAVDGEARPIRIVLDDGLPTRPAAPYYHPAPRPPPTWPASLPSRSRIPPARTRLQRLRELLTAGPISPSPRWPS